MDTQVSAGKQIKKNRATPRPRATAPQKIERKRINIVIKVVQTEISGNSIVIGVHIFLLM